MWSVDRTPGRHESREDRPQRPRTSFGWWWQDLQRELGRVEGRLEITETAESTLREDLERERRRADEERARAERERERADELRRELEAERARASQGFWRRLLFGG